MSLQDIKQLSGTVLFRPLNLLIIYSTNSIFQKNFYLSKYGWNNVVQDLAGLAHGILIKLCFSRSNNILFQKGMKDSKAKLLKECNIFYFSIL
jgi:hypothetical protein